MPITSRGVAHVNVVWPASACTHARAVHLWALTCGRSAAPGRAAAIVATLRSTAAESATSAGVPSSEINTPAASHTPHPPFRLLQTARGFIWGRQVGGGS